MFLRAVLILHRVLKRDLFRDLLGMTFFFLLWVSPPVLPRHDRIRRGRHSGHGPFEYAPAVYRLFFRFTGYYLQICNASHLIQVIIQNCHSLYRQVHSLYQSHYSLSFIVNVFTLCSVAVGCSDELAGVSHLG